jgi:hypothetical protein
VARPVAFWEMGDITKFLHFYNTSSNWPETPLMGTADTEKLLRYTEKAPFEQLLSHIGGPTAI